MRVRVMSALLALFLGACGGNAGRVPLVPQGSSPQAGFVWHHGLCGISTANPRLLFVTDPRNELLNVFEYPSMTLCANSSASNGAFSAGFLALNPSGNLFVANNINNTTSNIVAYSQPAFDNQPFLTITKGVMAADNIFFDANKNLIVFNADNTCLILEDCKNQMIVYAPPYTGAPTTVLHIGSGLFLAGNSAGDIFVSTSYMGGVAEYSPPYTQAPKIVSKGYNNEAVGNATLDSQKNLWVGFVTRLEEFPYPYTSGPMRKIVLPTVSAPTVIGDIIFNGTELFVYRFEFNGSTGSSTIRMYKSPYTGSPFSITDGGKPLSTIGVSAQYKQSMLIDENGNLLVAGSTFPQHDGFQPVYEWKNVDNYQQAPLPLTVNERPWHIMLTSRL